MLAVARTGDDAFGREVRREIERIADRVVAIGAVYSTLDRLESKGIVASDRARVGTPSRRISRVTREGARAVAETRAMRERLWQGVELRRLLGAEG